MGILPGGARRSADSSAGRGGRKGRRRQREADAAVVEAKRLWAEEEADSTIAGLRCHSAEYGARQ